MPDPAVTASGERFARDMRRIRDANGISMEDIHSETMISLHIIESFEQDGLFEHPTFNRVYLRSFIRSYANAAGVDAEDALNHLERALAGQYANELAVEYLGDEPEEPPTPEATGDEASSRAVSSAARGRSASSSSSAPSEAGESAEAESDEEESDTADDGPDGNQRGILIGIGVVLFLVIAWVLISTFRGNDNAATTATSGVGADTMDTTMLAADSLEALEEPLVDIGDTMYFTLIAQERLNPIRIQRDADLRRPYYFNRGQAGVFPARQQIVIAENLENIRLLVNGHEYPELQTLEAPLVLTRDSVQLFLDSTTTEPLQLIVPADTFPVIGG